MNSLETRRLEMLTRVRDFGVTHAAEFPAASLGGEQFAVVGQVVEELTRLATTQSTGAGAARQGSASRAEARDALREDLQAIARTARAMSLDVTGLENKFRLPRSGSDQSLLTSARAFAADAAPLKSDFIRHEMPADFLDDLNADIEAFERAVNSQNTGKGAQVTATAAIDAAVERGLNALQRLDAVVRNKFRNDPARLAAWESARHTPRLQRPKFEKPAPDGGPQPSAG